MKKLLILLFSLTVSFNALADNIVTGTCVVNVQEDGNIKLLGDSNIIDGSELLTVCSEGDILNLGGFEYFDTPLYFNNLSTLEWDEEDEILMENSGLSSSSKFKLSLYMARYCDLKETHIIGNEILVCKLVDRDL